MIHENILSAIGKTPLVKINKIIPPDTATVVAKLEYFNPAGSVKDRPALSMINDAEERNLINRDTIIIEPTSGNTGIGLAMACAVKGYKLILTMPESMSVERRKLLSAFGAELVLTPAEDGMKGSIAKAEDLLQKYEDSYMPMQFKNPANPAIHKITTAIEIWEDTNGKADILVACAGTGGTITGITETLKNKKPDFKTIAVEPAASPVISGGPAGRHKIPGTGPGFIPEILNTKILDEIIKVSDEEALETTRLAAKQEGLLCGISSGAALFVAKKVALRPENQNKLIVVILPDTGERYLSEF